jgi:hypothetical protein
MNKLAYQPLPVLLRAEPSEARPTSNSAKFLRVIAALGTLFTLCGVGAIFFIGFKGLSKKETKEPVEVPLASASILSPAATPNVDRNVEARLPEPKQVLRGTIAEDRSIVDQPLPAPSANPTSTPAEVLQSEASVSEADSLKRERSENARINSHQELPGVIRKNLERRRRKAERARSRLEELYDKHAISWEAYKKGEQKYKSQIEKYRAEVNTGAESSDQESSDSR